MVLRLCHILHFFFPTSLCGVLTFGAAPAEPRGSFLLAGAALQALHGARARFGAPPLDAPGAALWSLAARFCWQGQHFRLWTVPERVSGPPCRCCQAQHFRASLEPRGSFLLAGAAALQALDGARARFGAPPLDAARRSTFELRGSFLLAGAALQALDGARARFGAPPLSFRGPPFDAGRRSTFEPRGSFLLAGAALQALDGARARSGPPPSMLPGAALGSLTARFCWQGQHFRLWTVPERVSGPPPLTRGSFLLAGAALQALDGARARFGAPPSMLPGAALGSLRLVSAGRGSTSGSGRCPSAFRGPPP